MKSAYFIIHLGKNPPPQNGCRLKSIFLFIKNADFTSSTFPIQLDFSQNQPATITLNTGSPRTLAYNPYTVVVSKGLKACDHGILTSLIDRIKGGGDFTV